MIKNTNKDEYVSKFSMRNVGIRQGGNLSPRLFSLFIDDLEDNLIRIRQLCLRKVMYRDSPPPPYILRINLQMSSSGGFVGVILTDHSYT